IFSSLKSVYNNINPSTLTGAIDIIVVKQEDGTFRCTPFHVRFGKLGVLQSLQKKVYVAINGETVDLWMQLGEAGEAVFIDETINADDKTQLPIDDIERHLEPSNVNTFLDPDNALDNALAAADNEHHTHLTNIDRSPQFVNKNLDIEKALNDPNILTTPTYAYEQAEKEQSVDVFNSTVKNNTNSQNPNQPTRSISFSMDPATNEIAGITTGKTDLLKNNTTTTATPPQQSTPPVKQRRRRRVKRNNMASSTAIPTSKLTDCSRYAKLPTKVSETFETYTTSKKNITYRIERHQKESISWKGREYGCSGRLNTKDHIKPDLRTSHLPDPDPEKLAVEKVVDMKKRCEHQLPYAAFQASSQVITDPQIAAAILSFESLSDGSDDDEFDRQIKNETAECKIDLETTTADLFNLFQRAGKFLFANQKRFLPPTHRKKSSKTTTLRKKKLSINKKSQYSDNNTDLSSGGGYYSDEFISDLHTPHLANVHHVKHFIRKSSSENDLNILQSHDLLEFLQKNQQQQSQQDLKPSTEDVEQQQPTSTIPVEPLDVENDLTPTNVKRNSSFQDEDNISLQYVDALSAVSRLNSIDSRKILFQTVANIETTTDSNDYKQQQEHQTESEQIDDDDVDLNIADMKTSRTASNPIAINFPSLQQNEGSQSPIQNHSTPKLTNNSSMSIIDTLLSKSAPTDNSEYISSSPININTNSIRLDQSRQSYYINGDFSPRYDSPLSPRPTSPKSDTEYELEKSVNKVDSSESEWQWKWGELPERPKDIRTQPQVQDGKRRGVLSWFGSSKKSPGDMYLDDIRSNRCDPSLYLPKLEQNRRPEDDQDSGKGYSMPQSPFREHETSCMLGDVQLSLCGNISKQLTINDDLFNKHFISYEQFITNTNVINDPNLVVRMNGKYYNWAVASRIMAAASIYHQKLPQETIDTLQEKHMTQEPTKPIYTSERRGWWSWGKKAETPVDSSTKTITGNTTQRNKNDQLTSSTDMEPCLKSNQSFDGTNKMRSISKADDSELEDNEVTKITADIEEKAAANRQQVQDQEQQPQHAIPKLGHQQSTGRKKMILSSDQLKKLNLKLGMNKIQFSVTTALQGTTVVESYIFLFDYLTKFVISDIDGTITRSDALGQILPLVGKDWSHDGIAEFFNAIQENGYQFVYLSARAIGQSRITRDFLRNIKQCGCSLPPGPLLISPDSLMTALYREVIAKKPEEFKIECLKNIASLFPDKNPFYAGFGNRINDQWAYTAVGIPLTRIFTINPRGEVVRQKLQALQSSYRNLHEVVDLIFPPMDHACSETYSAFTYWRSDPIHSDTLVQQKLENEMRESLEESAQQQLLLKSKDKAQVGKNKSKTQIPSSTTATKKEQVAPTTQTAAGAPAPTTTPLAITKTKNNEKLVIAPGATTSPN
ncbi:unnamed protein product, partial [Didymodactylos carnosus]